MDTPPNSNNATSEEKRKPNGDSSGISGPLAGAIPQEPPPDNYETKATEKRRWTKDPPMFWVTLAGVVAVLAYTAVAFWQAQLTQGQLAVMHGQLDVLKNEQRAWIAPRGFVFPPPANFVNSVNQYTEATLALENVGKEPALKTNEDIIPIALAHTDWNNPTAMISVIQAAMHNHGCLDVPLNPNGPAIWPGAIAGAVRGFSEEDVKKINARTHFAMLAGCIVYETLQARHETEVCQILELVSQGGGWRNTNCTVYQQAN